MLRNLLGIQYILRKAESVAAYLQRSQDVGERLSVCVVAMHR